MAVTLRIIKNFDQLRQQLDAIFAGFTAAQPSYGASLPAVGSVPDGKLFVAAGVLYQAQSGSWVAV